MNSDWTNLRGPITGLQPVDLAYRDLMGDLQAVSVAENAQEAHAVALSLPPLRRAALALVDVARETHEAMAAEQDALRAKVQASSGEDLVRLFSHVSGALQAALRWIPSDRRQRLRETAPRAGFTEFLRRLERLNWAYIAVTCVWASAVARAQEYAQLIDAHAELEIEHGRRNPGPAAVGAVSLATGLLAPEDEKKAVKILEAYFPLKKVRGGKYGGTQEDRELDYPQEILRHAVELVAKLRDHPPQSLLAQAYDGDGALTHLPHAAMRDFMNRLKQYRDAERHRRVTDPGGKDPNVWTPEETRQALGGSPARERLRHFCMAPPPAFLDNLPSAERKAFEALRGAVLQGTLPQEGGMLQAIAKAAGVSPAAITRLITRIRPFL